MKFQSINQSLFESQKLKFDILKLSILKRFDIFCFNNKNWIDESQSKIMNELAEVVCFSDKHFNSQIWNGEVEKHKINIVVVLFFNLFRSNFEILQECNLKVHQTLYLKSKWLQILSSTIYLSKGNYRGFCKVPLGGKF